MTMVVSIATQEYIVMANDCGVVNEFTDGRREYDTGRKFWVADGIGCVSMWGARDGNHIVKHLTNSKLDPMRHSVEDLASEVFSYLAHSYSPHMEPLSDTGYHVGGFGPDGAPRLYHIFWNAPGSTSAPNCEGQYVFQLQHPREGYTRYLYNGRNDLASSFIRHFIEEVKKGTGVNFARTPTGQCRLAHFLLRFAAEMTPEVSPPFVIHFLRQDRKVKTQDASYLCPVDDAYFASLTA